MLRSLSHIGQKRFVSEGLNRQGLGQIRQRGGPGDVSAYSHLN
ncbi:unnamed protein product, partial [Brassica rapa]